MRTAICLVLAATLARANDVEATRAVVSALRDYYGLLASPGDGNITSVRDRLVANLKACKKSTITSVCRQLNKGLDRKYEKSETFHRCVAESLAAGGRTGIVMLSKRYRGSSKRDDIRLIVVEALAGCADEQALSPLRKAIDDKSPSIAAAAIRGCGKHAYVDGETRKKVVEILVKRYGIVADGAAGGDPDSPAMKMYLACKPAFHEALTALTRGEKLDSPAAWEAWFRENRGSKWPD